MAAITIHPTPGKCGLGRGFYVDAADLIQKCKDVLGDTASNFDSSTNTVDEFLTAVEALRDEF